MNPSAPADPVVQSAARWFWWIAAMSLVNTVMAHTGSNSSFVIGLAMTAFADGMAASAPVAAFVLTGVLLAFYVLMGLFGIRGKAWAFYAGIAVYVVDALIYVCFDAWLCVAFHVYAIFWLAKGVMRLNAMKNAPAEAIEAA
ncbi:MAG: hypothetical protein ACJ8GW_01210 [Massilia sp.]